MTIGKTIKTLRIGKGITQEELAKAAGTTKQAIYKYENEIVTNIPMDRLTLIARKLCVSPAYLMGWETVDEKQGNNPFDDAILSMLKTISDEDKAKVIRFISGLISNK